MYKGELTVDELMADVTGDEGSIASATVAYGVARWLRDNGREEEGVAMLEKIVAGPQWAAFGHIAAEAELYGPGR